MYSIAENFCVEMNASREAGVVRVTIDHFNLTAEEISRLWADQDKYIDLLESRLGKASQREQKMMSKLLKKKQELFKMTAQLEKVEVSRVSELGLSEGGWVCNKCWCQALRKKHICQIPYCPSSNKSPENIKRVCTSCFISLTKSFSKSVTDGSSEKKTVKKRKKVHLYSILKPKKTFLNPIEQSDTDTATEREEEQGGGQNSEVSTQSPPNPQKEDSSMVPQDQSDTDTATEREEEQGMGQHSEVSIKPPSVDQSDTDTATDSEQVGGEDSEVSTKIPPSPEKEDSSGGNPNLEGSHCKMFDMSGLYQVLPDQAKPVPVPLVSMEVSAVVRNFVAEVELRQNYHNKENIPLEVTYFFPVEEEASVISCKALMDGENIFICPLFNCINI